VFVVTDGLEVAEVAKKYGADIIWQKSQWNYKNLAGSVAFMLGLTEAEKILRFDTWVSLLPTSPLKTRDDIDNAIDVYHNYGHQVVVSVSKLDEVIIVQGVNGRGQGMFYDNSNHYYRYNGAISVTDKEFYKMGWNAGLLNGEGKMREDVLAGTAKIEELVPAPLWGNSVIGLYVMPSWTQYDIDDVETLDTCAYWFHKKILRDI